MIKKISNFKFQISNGYSLIELLVVLMVFSVLTVLVVQSLSLSLKGSRKSENITQVRENTEYAMNVMDRLLKGAKSVTSCTGTQIIYFDNYDFETQFDCLYTVPYGTKGYIASGSGAMRVRLTSSSVYIDCTTNPVFTCPAPIPGVPPLVEISIDGRDANSTGEEGASVTSRTRILLRVY